MNNQTGVNMLDSTKRQQYKLQKQYYRDEKKRVTQELLSTLEDPTVIVMSDWLKIRGTLRKWMRFYCVLRPGLFMLYKSTKTDKNGFWVGTVLLNCCELIERPSKKNGFCFKLYHPLDQSVWATRGPHGESIPSVTMPLPGSHLICRATSDEAGHCWMDALELAVRCSSLLMRTMHRELHTSETSGEGLNTSPSVEEVSSPVADPGDGENDRVFASDAVVSSHAEAERHFTEACGPDDESDSGDEGEQATNHLSDIPETVYIQSAPEVFGALGNDEQTEEVDESNKSLIWALMKTVRPGMDLSKVVLPTFILEPRSFLERLTDYYYHVDLLKNAIAETDPYRRMKAVLKFYLSGLYKKPKGLKKPYNPILGEVCRCYWKHADGSRTFYIAEQVSHHPPISAFYLSNRKVGFNICGTILAKSKFYGNSVSALLIGSAYISLLERGETYVVTLPYAHCKGLILGTLTMELGGTISACCERTGYSAEIDFKLKPFLGGMDSMNAIGGKIKLGKETLADIDGHWDGAIFVRDRHSGEQELFWQPSSVVIEQRLQRFVVDPAQQEMFESEKLWSKVTDALQRADQYAATDEKTVLEDDQRRRARELKSSGATYEARYFRFDAPSGQWLYKHADYRPWDPLSDLMQFEHDFCIQTKGIHRAPQVGTGSILAVNDATVPPARPRTDTQSSGSSHQSDVDKGGTGFRTRSLSEAMRPLKESVDEMNRRMVLLQYRVDGLMARQGFSWSPAFWLLLCVVFGAVQATLWHWWTKLNA